MMERVIFKEEQKFGSMRLYISMGLIYAGVTIFFAFALYSQFVLNEPWGNNPMSDKGLLLTVFLVLTVLIISAFFLFRSKLVVKISKTSISLTFKPILKREIKFPKDDIVSFQIRKYKPIIEYGGWGIKQGKKEVGKAYNVHGNIGLQLIFKDGKKVLIGTQRSKAIVHAMNKMMEKI